MRKQSEHIVCGCAGRGKPAGDTKALEKLALLVAALERREAERKAVEVDNTGGDS